MEDNSVMTDFVPKGRFAISTLDGMQCKLRPGRMSGNSTKIVDNAIQIIMNGHVCVVRDHHENGKSQKSNVFYLIV